MTQKSQANPDPGVLFSPCRVGQLTLRNRIAMAPMTRSRARDDGTPTPLMARYYAQRSEAGLIVSEGTNISAQGQGFLNTPGAWREAHREGWRQVVEQVHAAGSTFFMQLWHVGRIGHSDNMEPSLHPVAPSALAFARTVVTRRGSQPAQVPVELSTREVRQTVQDYAAAARLAVGAGCDGVEIHAANGYLPSQFLHASTNLRSDEYGGSVANRIRFLVEAAQACADAVGADRVGVRLTPFTAFNGASSPDEPELYDALLAALVPAGLAYLHVVGAEVSGNVTVQVEPGRELPDVLGFVRARWPGTLIAAGGYDRVRAERVVESGAADMVAFGRDFISNPDLVTRLRQGHALARRDPTEWYGPGAEGYTDYPRWAESTAAAEPAQELR